MSRPDPIQYAERLYTAIRTANFSPISFLAFGNAVKDGVDFRRMPRMAAEPFMRVVGEMLDLEEETSRDIADASVVGDSATPSAVPVAVATVSSGEERDVNLREHSAAEASTEGSGRRRRHDK